MAKSMRSKIKKKFRAAQRASVGEKQVNKALRKTTRKVITGIVLPSEAAASGEKPTLDALRHALGGAGGASSRLVTLEPEKKKKLRFTFNAGLRKQRLETALEDETDEEVDEEEDEEEIVPVGAETAGGNAVIRERDLTKKKRGSGEGGGADEDEEDGGAEVVESAAMLRAPDKPLGKRDMTTRHAEWAVKDIAQPLSAGMFEVSGGANKQRREAYRAHMRAKAKAKGGKAAAKVAAVAAALTGGAGASAAAGGGGGSRAGESMAVS